MSEKIKHEIQCDRCGKTYILEVEEKDLDEYYNTPRNRRRLVQEIFHYLTPQERELIISQTCNECFLKMWSMFEVDEEVDEDDN